MLGRQVKTIVKTVFSFLKIYEDRYRKEWVCFNPVGWTTIACTCLEIVFMNKILRKGLDVGLSKQPISNLFSSQGALRTANLSPLTAIERFSGVHNGKI